MLQLVILSNFLFSLISTMESYFLIDSRERSTKLVKVKTVANDEIRTFESNPVNNKIFWFVGSINQNCDLYGFWLTFF